jgi:type 1 glutamine amidotransferase
MAMESKKSSNNKPSGGISRRSLVAAGAAAAAAALPLARSAKAQRRMTPGGTGDIRVLLITKGHAFDRANFFEMFDALGDTITWTHVEHPAATEFWDPELAKDYDVFVYYDMAGRGGRNPDGTPNDIVPTAKMKKNLSDLLKQGKGMVFFHHALASWVHTWPEYIEIMGGAADWGRTIKNVSGKEYPFSGFRPNTREHITVGPGEEGHPVVAGLTDGFDIVDETYLAPMLEDKVNPLLRTDFVPTTKEFEIGLRREPNWNHPPGSNMTAWYKAAENSPIVYIQHGHDDVAWSNANFRRLMENAIRWTASKEAHEWAKANPAKIF